MPETLNEREQKLLNWIWDLDDGKRYKEHLKVVGVRYFERKNQTDKAKEALEVRTSSRSTTDRELLD